MNNSFMGGYNPPSNLGRHIDNSKVKEFEKNCVVTDNDRVLQGLALGLMGSINKMENPDEYGKVQLDDELYIQRNKLAKLNNDITNKIRQEAQEKQRRISQDALDELNILLGTTSNTNSAQVSSTQNTVSTPKTSIVKSNTIDPVLLEYQQGRSNQSELPLFKENSGGLSEQDKDFIVQEIHKIEHNLIERINRFESLISSLITVLKKEQSKEEEPIQKITEQENNSEDYTIFDFENDKSDESDDIIKETE